MYSAESEDPCRASDPPHCRAIREMLDKHMLGIMLWCDNRDMIADPLTKGKTRRNILNQVLSQAEWIVEHKMEFYPARVTDLHSHSAQEGEVA